MYRNPVAIFFLALIPGLGHFAVGRKGRAFVYPLLCFGLLGVGIMLSIASRDDVPFFVMLFLSVVAWLVNMVDIIVYLLRHPVGMVNSMNGPHGHGPAGGAVPMEGQPMGGAANGGAIGGQGQDAGEKFYTILLSFIPGLGHLQLGLMHRGLTLMVGFFGLLSMIAFIAILTDQSGFLVFLGVLPIIWLFGMVDAAKLVRLKQQGEVLKDSTILEDWDSQRESGRRSRLFATLLAVFPGAGHMYLGLQRRGLQLMAAFLFSIYILDALKLSLFLFLVPLIWCYSFFDGLQQSARYEQSNGQIEDVPIVDWLMNQQRWVGIGLLALGLFYIFDQLLLDLIVRWFDDYRIASEVERYFQTGLVALLLIGGGLKLLVGSRKRGRKHDEE